MEVFSNNAGGYRHIEHTYTHTYASLHGCPPLTKMSLYFFPKIEQPTFSLFHKNMALKTLCLVGLGLFKLQPLSHVFLFKSVSVICLKMFDQP